MNLKYLAILALSLLVLPSSAVASQGRQTALVYDQSISVHAPVPAMERGLQTVTAERWLKVSDEQHELEGAAFDREGRLYFCDVTARSIMRVVEGDKLETVVSFEKFAPGGIAFGPDGRLYAAAIDMGSSSGIIASVNSDGTDMKIVLSPDAGFMPNDLVFDEHGGFYFTDFKGTASEPTGGVYYLYPDMKKVEQVISNIAQANGIALSPDGRVLWATEFGANRLHRAELEGQAKLWPLGRSIPYRFIGPAPDSMRVDADGNVYVAMYWQGRVMVFNKNGFPIAQALLEGCDENQIASTSLAIHPETKDMYIVGRTIKEGEGAWVYRAGAFAPGLPAK